MISNAASRVVYSRYGGLDLRVLDPRTEATLRGRSSSQWVGPRRGHPILDGILPNMEEVMKVWSKPAVREQEVGLEVTSYMPAEIDII